MIDRPFAINEFTTHPQSFEQDIDLYSALRIPFVELCQFKLKTARPQAAAQLQRLRDAGLAVASVQPMVHSLFPDSMAPLPADPADRMACFRDSIELITALLPETAQAHVPFVLIGGAAPRGNIRRGWEELQRLLPDLLMHAADHGVKIAFETLHPILMNTDTFISGLDDAFRILEQFHHPALGLVIDTWHIWPEPNLVERLAAHKGSVLAVHASDWPRGGPRTFNDRAIPGSGTIDFRRIFAALNAADYHGPITLELLSDPSLPDSLWRADLAQVIQSSLDNLAHCSHVQ